MASHKPTIECRCGAQLWVAGHTPAYCPNCGCPLSVCNNCLEVQYCYRNAVLDLPVPTYAWPPDYLSAPTYRDVTLCRDCCERAKSEARRCFDEHRPDVYKVGEVTLYEDFFDDDVIEV